MDAMPVRLLISKYGEQRAGCQAPYPHADTPGKCGPPGVPGCPSMLRSGSQAGDRGGGKDRQSGYLEEPRAQAGHVGNEQAPDTAAHHNCRRAQHKPDKHPAPPADLTIEPDVQSVHARMLEARLPKHQMSRGQSDAVVL